MKIQLLVRRNALAVSIQASIIEFGPESGFSYLPCHAFVTTTRHNAASQKDLAPSTESPAKCRVFSFHRHAFHEAITERSAD
jgi:hypothetical protein